MCSGNHCYPLFASLQKSDGPICWGALVSSLRFVYNHPYICWGAKRGDIALPCQKVHSTALTGRQNRKVIF